MAVIGYHCAHEQHSPGDLLRNVLLAEQAGFHAAMCSDHFAPWSSNQGHSGFAWSWLGSALQATGLSFGTVTAPGQRYHPAVTAQAAATLAQMYPSRLWVALGTGEALNEHITGDTWPTKPERKQRLSEVVSVLRALFAGETVTHTGLIRVSEAKLYSLPAKPPLLIGAAVTAATAEWVGSWADGLITCARPEPELRRIVEAFRRGGGAGKPMFLQTAMSYAKTEAEAERVAFENWRTNTFSSEFNSDTHLPERFDAAALYVRPEDMRRSTRISADLFQHLAWLVADLELGFDRIYLHHVGTAQEEFIDAFASRVLPQVSQGEP
jgi:coenzyme F420-dependent glucose-6-phosphate dehydrogenase